MVKLTRVFQPIKIGSLELPNRIIMTAMNTGWEMQENNRYANFYAERARGGVGLIMLGNIMTIFPSTWPDNVPKNTIMSDSDVARIKKWTQAVHDNGGRVGVQLSAYGRWAKGGKEATVEAVSPSGVILHGKAVLESRPENLPSRPLTIVEIHTLERMTAEAAVRSREAGFDAIEIQAVGGNLLNLFLSTATNKRNDEYGGNLENRIRFLLETIALVKKKVGDDFPLICRICGEENMPGGLNVEDYQQVAPLIEKAGIHAIDIIPHWQLDAAPCFHMCIPRGHYVPLAEVIKQTVKIPVITNIRINDIQMAEQILQDGKADCVAMCRAFITDPEMLIKAREGRLEDIRMCTGCCICFGGIAKGGITCSVNARVGKEAEYVITPAAKPKKVYVIGGGPGGMEAARVAALRGHQVTIFEKENKLGGQLNYAVLPPFKEEWKTTIAYLSSQMKKLKVKVKLNTEITAAILEKDKPDAVIAATGAVPLIPNIPGIKGKNVATALEILTGNKLDGQNYIVIGGGATGCETAEFLHQKGKKVTLLEMLPEIGADIDFYNKGVVLDRLATTSIKMLTSTKAEEITDRGVTAKHGDTPVFFTADVVVIAIGMKANNALVKELQGKVAVFYAVGDCQEVHRVAEAIQSGFKVGLLV